MILNLNHGVRPSWVLTNEVKVLCRSITVILNVFIMFEITLTTRKWQVHFREDLCEGSQYQICEVTDRNVILGLACGRVTTT